MTAVLVVALALPVTGAVSTLLWPSRADRILLAASAGSAGCWAALAAWAADPARELVGLGLLEVDAIGAGAVAGAALVAGARPSSSAFGTSAGLTAVTLLGGASAAGDLQLPDRALGVALVALGALAALRTRSDGAGLVAALLALAAGALAGAGLLLDDPAPSAILVLGGLGLAVELLLRSPEAGLALVPGALLAMARATEAPPVVVDRIDLLAVGVAGVVGVVAVGLAFGPTRPAGVSVGVAAAVSGAALLAVDAPGMRSAGLLLAAGGVLAAVGERTIALVSLAPGAVAAVDALAVVTEPEDAAVLGAVLALLVVGVARADARPSAPWWWAAPGVAFGVLPTAGWAGASVRSLRETVLVAAAAALAALVVWTAPAVRRADGAPWADGGTAPDPDATSDDDLAAIVHGERTAATAASRRRGEPLRVPDTTAPPPVAGRVGGRLVARPRTPAAHARDIPEVDE